MKKQSYSDQLKDPRWQRKRLEILQRADFSCETCEETTKTLHVHHKIYRKGCLAWEYADTEFAALCEDCHLEETLLQRELAEAIAQLSVGELATIVGFAQGTVATNQVFGDDDLSQKEWSLRSYDHAWGFAARVLGPGFPPAEVYALIDFQPLTSQKIFHLGSNKRDPILDRIGGYKR